ncbi:MAG: nicotinic acid mononucleotide adenylyltransferase, partial [Actinomycetota bacterium]
GWRTRRVEIPSLAVSSTEIRALVAAGRSVRHLVPEPVIHRMAEWGLYRRSS